MKKQDPTVGIILPLSQLARLQIPEALVPEYEQQVESILHYFDRIANSPFVDQEAAQRAIFSLTPPFTPPGPSETTPSERFDPEVFLSRAPERENNYFVVPKVIGD